MLRKGYGVKQIIYVIFSKNNQYDEKKMDFVDRRLSFLCQPASRAALRYRPVDGLRHAKPHSDKGWIMVYAMLNRTQIQSG